MSARQWHATLGIVVASVSLISVLGAPAGAFGHGANGPDYRTVIESVEPAGLPIDVTIAKGDQMRFQNIGDSELVVCGYTEKCDPYVRIGPQGVYENRNSAAYFANLESNAIGEIPTDAGDGPPEWKLVRREPPFYAYHDHRSHWMVPNRLPPGVDASNHDVQKVSNFEIDFQYDGRDGVVKGRLEYVGGQTFLMKYGEYGMTAAAIAAMLGVFVVDARRRRQRRIASEAAASGDQP